MSTRPQSVRGSLPRPLPRVLFLSLAVVIAAAGCSNAPGSKPREPSTNPPPRSIQLGPRPFYLVDEMQAGPLRERLAACTEGPFRPARFSIGHRGAPMQFPEHTRASYRAAARMGAGVLECDVTFTADLELVCRHSQCDLATTTNILETPLAEQCSETFRPAVFDPETGEMLRQAGARCCTSDLSLAEYHQLEAKMDARNPRATHIAEYLDATAAWRTDLYSNGAKLLSHAESLALFKELGVDMTPELKAPQVDMPYEGEFTQRDYARKLLDAYRDAGIPPERVQLQSFDAQDIRFWLEIAPDYGAHAIFLVEPSSESPPPPLSEFEALYAEGFRTIAPPISTLLDLDAEGHFVATEYAKRARQAGLEIVAWSLERSGRIRTKRVEGRPNDFYLGPLLPALEGDGDLFRVIDALVQEVGIRALFSDWPATTTYYANCLGLD